MRYVYVIAATAPDGAVHRYVGQSAYMKTRMVYHRRRHERGVHRNIPAAFMVNWDAIEVMGPFAGTPEEIAKGEEQNCYDRCLLLGPVLNKMPPRNTTADALIAACGLGAKKHGMRAARAAQKPEDKAAASLRGGITQGERNRVSGHMSAVGKVWGAIHGPEHIKKARAAQTLEAMSARGKRNGAKAGRIAVESGRLASYNTNRTPEERSRLAGNAGKVRAKNTNARRWGVETEPGLWISRKTGAVLLDQR